ncbi:MAG: hypothetical protein JO112_14045 [Planctomycetes bacterium]|nr:hypothetical protein [Planctomycetota bacterium]
MDCVSYAEQKEGIFAAGAFLESRCQEPLPIAVAESHAFMQLMYYADPALKNRLVYVTDPEASVRYLGYDTDEHALPGLSKVTPLPVMDYASFMSSHSKFYVFGSGGWLPAALEDDGASFQGVGRYQRKNPLYLVTLEHEKHP